MPRMNELLGAGSNYSRGVAVQFGLEEQEGAATMSPELVATSDIHQRPEQWALHGGTLLWGSVEVAAGGAGFNSQCAIEPGLGELVVVESISYSMDNPGGVHILALSTTPLTSSTGNLVARDARRIITAGGSGGSGTRLMTQNNAAVANIATQVWRWTIPNAATNSQQTTLPVDMVLVSPWSLRLFNNATNSILAPFLWRVRVRPATPRELAAGPTGAL